MVINPIAGVYIPIIRIPIKGGMTIPNIATFDHGTNGLFALGMVMVNGSMGQWVNGSMGQWVNGSMVMVNMGCDLSLE